MIERDDEPDCPLSVREILWGLAMGKARQMTKSDLMGYAGVEGEGFMWECEEMPDVCVVYDLQESGVIVVNVYEFTDAGRERAWAVELGRRGDAIACIVNNEPEVV